MDTLQSLRQRLVDLINQDFSQGVLWNIGSLVILALGGVLVNLLIVSIRGPQALGIFNQVYSVYIVLSQIGVFGIHFSILKSVSYVSKDRSAYSNTVLIALLLIGLIQIPVLIITYLLADDIGQALRSPEVADGLRLALPGLGFFAFNKALANVLNGLNQMKAYAVVRSVRFILIPLAVIGIIAVGADDVYLVLSFSIAETLLFLAVFPYVMVRFLQLQPLYDVAVIAREHLTFGAKSAFSGSLLELNTRLDVLILGYFVSDEMVGIYSFTAILAEGFSQLAYAVRWSVDPLVGQFHAERQPERITQAARKIQRVFFPIMIGIGALAMIGYPPVYWLLFPNDFPLMSSIVFAILMVGVVINARYRPFTGFLLQSDMPGMYAYFMVTIVLVRGMVSVALTPSLEVYGIALATAFAYVFEGLFLAWLIQRLLKIRVW